MRFPHVLTSLSLSIVLITASLAAPPSLSLIYTVKILGAIGPFDVNEVGDISGFYEGRGIILRDDQLIYLQDLGYPSTRPIRWSDASDGRVVGSVWDGSGQVPAVWAPDGALTLLYTLDYEILVNLPPSDT